MMATKLFVIANVKKVANLGSFRILLPFFRTSWGVGILNSAFFNSFRNRVEFGTILEGLRNFGGRVEHPQTHPPLRTPLLTPDLLVVISVECGYGCTASVRPKDRILSICPVF